MRKLILAYGLLLFLSGCSSQPVSTSESVQLAPETSACLADLGNVPTPSTHALDVAGFSVVNWNIQKGRDADWVGDLRGIHTRPDLLILQEAQPGSDAWDVVAPGHFRSFAEGFGIRRSVTGVMTTSTAAPLAECELVAFEPWFGTRKATLVTEYALTSSNATLLVVNIHGVNFTFGVRHMREQLQQVATVIAEHSGPVLFSGDFNTWHGRRARMVEEVVADLGLEALDFTSDHRKRVFGFALDHVFVRGLDTVYATSMKLDSSDHNPMAVRFRVDQTEGGIKAAL